MSMLKTLCLALSMAVAGTTLLGAAPEVQAKRLAGGKPAGMQRQATPQPAPATPPQQAAPAPQPAAPAVAPNKAGAAPAAAPTPPKRSWMGPLAGLAAGLGIAALLSHFGMGEAVASALMAVLLGGLAVAVVVWLLRRFAGGKGASHSSGPQLAAAGGAPLPAGPASAPTTQATTAYSGMNLASPAMPGTAVEPMASPAQATASTRLGNDFDREGFERVARMLFIRLQAANDAGDVDDLRRFTTPELFASLRLDLQERGNGTQQTDVVQLQARVAEAVEESGQQIVSVHFDGLIREELNSAALPFDEIWHFVRPADASRDWAIAGITPNQPAP